MLAGLICSPLLSPYSGKRTALFPRKHVLYICIRLGSSATHPILPILPTVLAQERASDPR